MALPTTSSLLRLVAISSACIAVTDPVHGQTAAVSVASVRQPRSNLSEIVECGDVGGWQGIPWFGRFRGIDFEEQIE
ncbi:hypothetical protein AAHA92_12541 [Salvia divinorum]|uniref:Secreted protein n=1 Tax=Salvia divinorum TaxID=28513 RepID=A0ABD1HKK9_SALDI